jgi:signal transduction histidine kinase
MTRGRNRFLPGYSESSRIFMRGHGFKDFLCWQLLFWLGSGFSLRVRYISAAIRMRAEERADERVRIARELHDTLLRGIQGLLLSFHVAAQKVPADHDSKQALERALTTADHIIVEGRNRVHRLRSENLTDAELKSLIEGVADNLLGIASIEFSLERRGSSDTLQSHVVDEVFCITTRGRDQRVPPLKSITDRSGTRLSAARVPDDLSR